MGLNLLERLEASEIGQKLQKDFQNDTLEKRRSAAAEIKRITAEETKVLPGLLQAREKAASAVKAAEEALQDSRTVYRLAWGDVHNCTVRADNRRNQQEQILRGSYPPELDKFKSEMDELLRLTRSKGIDHRDHGHRSIVDSKWKPKVYSNSEAVLARLAHIRAAIAEAEGMKLEALSVEEVANRLKELKTRMPQTGVMKLAS